MAIENVEPLKHVVPQRKAGDRESVAQQRVLFLFTNQTKPRRKLYLAIHHNCSLHEFCLKINLLLLNKTLPKHGSKLLITHITM